MIFNEFHSIVKSVHSEECAVSISRILELSFSMILFHS